MIPAPLRIQQKKDQMDSDKNNLGSQHDQGEGYQQPITFRRMSQSGQVEIKIEYLIPTPLYFKELNTVVP